MVRKWPKAATRRPPGIGALTGEHRPRIRALARWSARPSLTQSGRPLCVAAAGIMLSSMTGLSFTSEVTLAVWQRQDTGRDAMRGHFGPDRLTTRFKHAISQSKGGRATGGEADEKNSAHRTALDSLVDDGVVAPSGTCQRSISRGRYAHQRPRKRYRSRFDF